MNVECHLAPTPDSVSQARRRVADALSDLPADTADRLALIVSELVTNAVVHAGTDFELSVRYADGHVWGEVSDFGDGEAAMRRPGVHDVHGRGLRIVDQLATEWGVHGAPSRPGKTVWFRLEVS